MAKTHKLVVMVTKEQKERIINDCKLFNCASVGEYVRESLSKKQFLILDKLDDLTKLVKELKNEQGRIQNTGMDAHL